MGAQEVNWRRVLSVWWLMAWRALLGGAVLGFVAGFLVGFIGRLTTLRRTYPAFAYKEYFCGLNRPKRLIRRNLFSKVPPNFARFRGFGGSFCHPVYLSRYSRGALRGAPGRT